MRIPIIAASLVAVLFATPAIVSARTPAEVQAPAPDAYAREKLELAREIVNRALPEESREEMYFASMDQMLAQTREAVLKTQDEPDPEIRKITDQWIEEVVAASKEVLRKHIPALTEGMVQVHARIFTLEELTDINAFAQTPSGQRFLQMSPALVAAPEFAAANQAYMDEVMLGMSAAQLELMDRIFRHMEQQAEMQEPTAS